MRADKNTEAGVMPSEKMLTDMGKYNEEPGAEFTPELREAEHQMRDQIEGSRG